MISAARAQLDAYARVEVGLRVTSALTVSDPDVPARAPRAS